MTLEQLRSRLAGLFPDRMGVRMTEVGSECVVATQVVRPDLCSLGGRLHGSRTTMVWQTSVRTEAGKLCAVVTQTQPVIDG